jgi:hypothetical protein
VAATGSSSVTGMRGSMRGIGGGQRAEQQRGCGAWPNGVGKEEEAERWGLLAVGMGKAPEPSRMQYCHHTVAKCSTYCGSC